MFDGDGKCGKPDESKRGRDGSATSKRPRITAGWNDSRKSTNEVTPKAREKWEVRSTGTKSEKQSTYSNPGV